MKKQYSFSIDSALYERFVAAIPETRRQHMIRRTLMEISIEEILSFAERHEKEDFTILTCWLEDVHVQQMQHFIDRAHQSNIKLKKTTIIEAIMNRLSKQLIEVKPKAFTLFVEANIKKALSQMFKGKVRNYAIEDYIFEKYEGPHNQGNLRFELSDPQQLKLTLDVKAIEKLDKYKEKFNVTRSAIVRDVLNQMLRQPPSDPKKELLKKRIIEDLKSLNGMAGPEEVKAVFDAIYNKGEGEEKMKYPEATEKLVTPGTEKEERYDTK